MAKKEKVVQLREKTEDSAVAVRKSLVETAFEDISEAIRNNTFKPGQRMLESEIAEWLKMSRTPVREALRRLVDSEFLSYDRYGNLVVTEFTRQMVIEIYAMRIILESAGARLAAQYAYDEEIDTMRNLVESFKNRELPNRERTRLNRLFRNGIINSSHNHYLIRAFRALPRPVRPPVAIGYDSPERITSIIAEYERLMVAIENRNAAEAEIASRTHIEASRRYWLERLNEQDLIC